jgi:putative hemolysin
MLASRFRPWAQAVRAALPRKPQQPIVAALPPDQVRAEVASLAAAHRLAENGEFTVLAVRADNAPSLLREIGRLREVTFRAVGEGTGKASDLDHFDLHYWHLILWDHERNQVVGAYRLGNSAEIIARYGIEGLYTNTLFRFAPNLFEKLGPALELGRSFVVPDYQRQYAPLMLLWKGIARFITAHPETPVLFGAVSISNDYHPTSREMIVRFFEARNHGDELAGMVRPRNPFRPAWLREYDCTAICRSLRDLEDLGEHIAGLEPDGKGLPILLKQYAKIGGRLIGFNVDRNFSNCLDGLMLVDLRQTQPAVLERYMGREGAATFRQCHAMI